jgi:hypothetical protein
MFTIAYYKYPMSCVHTSVKLLLFKHVLRCTQRDNYSRVGEEKE